MKGNERKREGNKKGKEPGRERGLESEGKWGRRRGRQATNKG